MLCAHVCVWVCLCGMSMCGLLVCECVYVDSVGRCGLREGCVWGCACACALHWDSVVVMVGAAWCGCADDVWLCCVVLVAVWCCVVWVLCAVLHACVIVCVCGCCVLWPCACMWSVCAWGMCVYACLCVFVCGWCGGMVCGCAGPAAL